MMTYGAVSPHALISVFVERQFACSAESAEDTEFCSACEFPLPPKLKMVTVTVSGDKCNEVDAEVGLRYF